MRARSPSPSWRTAFVLAALSLSAIGLACGPGFLDGISGGTKESDGGTPPNTQPEAGPSSCNSRLAPERPVVNDNINDAIAIPTLGFERMRFDTFGSEDAGGPRPLGLDLDQTCTCPQPDSCIRPIGRDAACDDSPRGEDNSLARLFNELNTGVPLFPQTFATDRIKAGQFSILVDVLGWNGEPNDPRVAVTIRLSQYSQYKKDKTGRELPLFDGQDIWTVDPDSVAGGDSAIGVDCRDPKGAAKCLARIRDDDAYVKDGKLVARPRLDSVKGGIVPLTVRSAVGSITLDYFDFTVLADITGNAESARLVGEMTGKIAASNVIFTFANMQDFTKVDEPPICESEALFKLAKTSVCGARDLAAPGKGTSSSCEFISVAFSFAASPAVIGTIFRKDTAPPPCGDAGYSCD